MIYILKKDSPINPKAKAGARVYPLMKPDYGLARDDERILGKPCMSMTLDPKGDYPSFVVLQEDIDFLKEEPFKNNKLTEAMRGLAEECLRDSGISFLMPNLIEKMTQTLVEAVLNRDEYWAATLRERAEEYERHRQDYLRVGSDGEFWRIKSDACYQCADVINFKEKK